MKKYRFLTLVIASLLTLSLCSCIFQPQDADGALTQAPGVDDQGSGETSTDTDDVTVTEITGTLTFEGDICKASDESAVVKNGKNYKIVKAGVYKITGVMNDGQIQVEVADTERVTLLLDNFDGTCSDSAVIYVINADRVYIDLEKGSVNNLTDGSSYAFANPADTKPNACIYASDDLTIKGGGRLNVYANYNNGIATKNDLEIKNGNITVSAVNNALKGNNSVTIMGDADITINNAEDAIKTENIDRADRGFIEIIEQARVVITCSDDALQATQRVTVSSTAKVIVASASSAVNCDGTADIADGSLIFQ